MNPLEWLKQHWFIFTTLVTCGIAWGQAMAEVKELQAKVERSQVILENQAKLEERTVTLQQDMKEQRQILIELLATQRAWAQKNKIIVEDQAPVKAK